jgi:pre-mRNA-splicing factor 38A
MRLVGKAVDVYQYLEPLYNDYRKVRFRQKDGSFTLSHIDEVGALGGCLFGQGCWWVF